MNTTKVFTKPIETLEEFGDLDAMYHGYFEDASVPTEVLMDWWKAYPKGLIGLLDQNHLVGGLSAWPLDDITFQMFLSGKMKERKIQSNNFDLQNVNKFYVSEIAIAKPFRRYIHNLLLGFLMNLRNEANFPLSLVAIGASPEGVGLMRRYGFEKQLDASETADGFPLFLIVFQSPEKIIEMVSNLTHLNV